MLVCGSSRSSFAWPPVPPHARTPCRGIYFLGKTSREYIGPLHDVVRQTHLSLMCSLAFLIHRYHLDFPFNPSHYGDILRQYPANGIPMADIDGRQWRSCDTDSQAPTSSTPATKRCSAEKLRIHIQTYMSTAPNVETRFKEAD